MDHILIDGTDKTKTVKIKKQQLIKGEKLIQYQDGIRLSPLVGETATTLEMKLYAIRGTLCLVNQTLRFPNEEVCLKNVTEWYKAACKQFFSAEISRASTHLPKNT